MELGSRRGIEAYKHTSIDYAVGIASYWSDYHPSDYTKKAPHQQDEETTLAVPPEFSIYIEHSKHITVHPFWAKA